MAYSAAALTAAEIAGFDNDKPVMVVQQAGNPNDAHWTFTGDGGDTDKTDAAYPASRAHDDIGSLVTKPTQPGTLGNVSGITAPGVSPVEVTATGHSFSNGDQIYFYDVGGMTQLNYVAADHNVYTVANKTTNTFQLSGVNSTGYGSWTSGGRSEVVKYYNFEFTSSTEISFDTLLILNHDMSGTHNMVLEIADNDSYSSNKIEVARHVSSGITDTGRWLVTNLNSAGSGNTYSSSGTAQRYSSVRYARLGVVGRYADVGEIFLGYRYQLQRNPDLTWNNKNEVSGVSDFQSRSGLTKRYVFYRGQAVRNVTMGMGASAEITVIDNWFNDINEGTRPFLWIDTPSSGAEARLMLLDDAGLNFPLVGPYERQLTFSMAEQPPFLSRE